MRGDAARRRLQLALMKQAASGRGGDRNRLRWRRIWSLGRWSGLQGRRLGVRRRQPRCGTAPERARRRLNRPSGGRAHARPLLHGRRRGSAMSGATARVAVAGLGAAGAPARAAVGSPARRVFTAAAAVVAAHTTTDAFIALEPGVSASEHLVSGLASLAVVTATVMAFGRARDGLRGALALALGVLAVEGFLLAAADTRAVGVHGDDWTGLALGPAGLTLLTLGAWLLWRSRKRAGRPYLRRAIVAAGAVLGVYWLIAPVGVAVMATASTRPACPSPRSRSHLAGIHAANR